MSCVIFVSCVSKHVGFFYLTFVSDLNPDCRSSDFRNFPNVMFELGFPCLFSFQRCERAESLAKIKAKAFSAVAQVSSVFSKPAYRPLSPKWQVSVHPRNPHPQLKSLSPSSALCSPAAPCPLPGAHAPDLEKRHCVASPLAFSFALGLER